MQTKGCTRATRKLLVTTRICKCECEMHCFVACRMLESNTIGWSFCKNPPPTPTLNTSTWSIKADWGLKWHETGPWAMSFLDSTKALPCESVHWKGTSLWVKVKHHRLIILQEPSTSTWLGSARVPLVAFAAGNYEDSHHDLSRPPPVLFHIHI